MAPSGRGPEEVYLPDREERATREEKEELLKQISVNGQCGHTGTKETSYTTRRLF